MKNNYIQKLLDRRAKVMGSGKVVLKEEVKPIVIIEKEPEPEPLIVEEPKKRGRKKKTDDNA